MSLPYPPPEAIKTTLRCKFRLPGRKYNCRALGKYLLNGVGYCACHYDTMWKVLNPIYGQQHDWHIRTGLDGTPYPYPTCRICCDIKPHEGLPVSPCKGRMPVIELRS